ncbi:hypothetical protein K8R43_01645 [archaeon]|nr:hypothetical protein [archaeon]
MNLNLQINVRNPKKAQALAKALQDGKTKRAEVTITAKKENIDIQVNAQDLIALRSAANSYLRLLDSCLKIIEG